MPRVPSIPPRLGLRSEAGRQTGAKINEARVRKRKLIGQLWVILEAQELRVHLKPELDCQALLPAPGQQQSSHHTWPSLRSSCSPPLSFLLLACKAWLQTAAAVCFEGTESGKFAQGSRTFVWARLGQAPELQEGFKPVARR